MLIKDFLMGSVVAYIKANRIIFKYRLWPYLILPGVLSFLVILLIIFLGNLYITDFSFYIQENWLPDDLKGKAMVFISTILLWIFLLIIGYMTYKQIVLIFFAPLLSHLSEVVEAKIYHSQFPDFNLFQFIKDFLRSAIINLRNLIYSTLLMIPAWLVIFIPVLGTVTSIILLFYIQSYYGGSSLVDYTLERKQYSVTKSLNFIKKNRALVTGVGSGFIIILLIPLIGWFAAPTYGTVAATLITLDEIKKTESKHQ